MNWIKKHWKKFSALLIPAAFAAGMETAQPAPGFDTKGIDDVRVQVLIKEPDFHDAIYYTPEEWQLINPQDIEAEENRRIENHEALVREQSQLVTPEATTTDEQIPN